MSGRAEALLRTVQSLLEDAVPADFEQWLAARSPTHQR